MFYTKIKLNLPLNHTSFNIRHSVSVNLYVFSSKITILENILKIFNILEFYCIDCFELCIIITVYIFF